MKKLIIIAALLIGITALQAQKANRETILIKTSGQCEHCKENMEKAMAYEKGVSSANLSMEDMVLTVEYDPRKTTPEKLRTALNKIGYDADDTKADPKAYAKLAPCCKKPEDR